MANEFGEFLDDTSLKLIACREDNVVYMAEVIASGFDTNEKVQGTFCLSEAVKFGSFRTVDLLLKFGASLTTVDFEGRRPLHWAINLDDFVLRWKMVSLLLRAGDCVCEPQGPSATRLTTTSIHEAVRKNDFRLVQILIEAGADINCFADNYDDYTACTPLHQAMTLEGHSRFEMVKQLIAAGSSLELHKKGYTCLHKAIDQSVCQWEVVKYVLDAGLNIDVLWKSNISLLALAAKRNHLDLARKLLDSGADPNASNKCSNSALYFAVTHQNKEIVNLLLQSGADVNARDDDGKSILFCAVDELRWKRFPALQTEILRIILKYTSVRCNYSGKYALLIPLVYNGSVDLILTFIEHGLNLENHKATFPVHRAAHCRDKNVLDYLLQSNIFDVNGLDINGLTPLFISVNYGISENVKLLIQYGADVNIICSRGGRLWPPTVEKQSPLSRAICCGQSSIAKILIGAGASIDFHISSPDVTCIMQAIENRDIEVNNFIELICLCENRGCTINPALMEKLIGITSDSVKVSEECNNEFAVLKEISLINSTSMFDVLIGKNFPLYINDVHLKKCIESLKTVCPRFNEVIIQQSILNDIRRRLMNKALISLYRISEFTIRVDDVLYNLMNNLTIVDLRNLCIT
ncbi:hypothetical protein QAD02_007847 [Eretmocerus hayati]|uniref:Uncharacterized protein n=1 Tax=Eretmocerus hayati TaxID=131215 RepID=A0ACC2N4S5_9HYME|nr:hypothetical protein QAD02_007847 [Eretmocerus hayati]